MKILITGHKGLIGSKIYNKLKKDHEVIGLDKYKTSDEELKNIYNNLKELDIIIHCGSNCIIRDIIKNPKLALENIKNIFNIYEIARKTNCKKIVYFSSSRVVHKEKNPYTAGKIFAEELSKAYKECYKIQNLIIRPETVWSLNDRHKRVIPSWILNALENKDIIVYGNEDKEISPMHVDTFIEHFMNAFNIFIKTPKFYKNPLQISGKPKKAKEIINIIKRLTNSKSKVIYKEQEIAQPQNCLSSDIEIDDFEQSLKKELDNFKKIRK